MANKKTKILVTYLVAALGLTSMLAMQFAVTTNAESLKIQNCQVILLGDLDGDGDVTLKDDALFKEYFAGKAVVIPNLSAADVNKDNEITRKDAMILARCLAKWSGYSLGVEDGNAVKQPSEYTWWEYYVLPDELKEAFYESFASDDAFIEWLNEAQENAVLPWEDGGKQPSEYTWWEYYALPDELKEAFYESFASDVAFMEWLDEAQANAVFPWEDGGKHPSEYTWWEYYALPEELKEAFYESFASDVAFEAWLYEAQANPVLPWEQ